MAHSPAGRKAGLLFLCGVANPFLGAPSVQLSGIGELARRGLGSAAYPALPVLGGRYLAAQSIPRWTMMRASGTSKSAATWPTEE